MRTQLAIDVPKPIEAVEITRPGARPAAQAPAPPPAPESALREAEARLAEERQGLARARAALVAAAGTVAGLQEQIMRDAESQLVDLALAIARKVVAQEIEDGRAKIQPLVDEALRHAPSRHDVVVRLNPQDLAACQPQAAAGNVRFVADGAVRRGECLVETAEGAVPATLADRFEEAGAALRHAPQG